MTLCSHGPVQTNLVSLFSFGFMYPTMLRCSLQAALRAFTGAPPSEAGATDGIGGAGAGAALGSIPRVLALVADLEVCLATFDRTGLLYSAVHTETLRLLVHAIHIIAIVLMACPSEGAQMFSTVGFADLQIMRSRVLLCTKQV